MLYLFAHELAKPLSEYPQLVQFIDECSAKAHAMDNVWLLERSDLPSNFEADLRAYIGPKDKFYLVDVSKSVLAWSGVEGEVADFARGFTEPVEQDVSQRLLTIALDSSGDAGLEGEHIRPLLENLWQVETGTSPEQFADELRAKVGNAGRLLVADVSLAPAAWSQLDLDTAYAAIAYTRTEQGLNQRQEF